MPGRVRPLWDRIFDKIIIPSDVRRGCWLWTGARRKARRGRRPHISRGRRGEGNVSVHQAMCEVENGPRPGELYEAGHTCPDGERADCVNPFHLTWQTRWENEQHKQTYREEAAC